MAIEELIQGTAYAPNPTVAEEGGDEPGPTAVIPNAPNVWIVLEKSWKAGFNNDSFYMLPAPGTQYPSTEKHIPYAEPGAKDDHLIWYLSFKLE
jgi:hypothetical protein